MSTESAGERTYEELYKELNELLETAAGGQPAVVGFARGIAILGSTMGALQEMTADGFADEDSEIGFYRLVWPRFYSKLFFYLLVHRFELVRSGLPAGVLGRLIRREEEKMTRFYRRHRDFWAYYRAESPLIGGQFTRAYSRGCLLEPLCWVLSGGATLASWWAAWGLAYAEYANYLQAVRDPVRSPGGDRWEWKETRSAAVELLKAMAEAGSVHVNGRPATTRQLRTLFEERFGMEIKDFDNLLYATDIRKIDATPYFTKLKEAFVARRERLGK